MGSHPLEILVQGESRVVGQAAEGRPQTKHVFRPMRSPAPDDVCSPKDRNYGELWGIMGNYGELWGIMGNYGE